MKLLVVRAVAIVGLLACADAGRCWAQEVRAYKKEMLDIPAPAGSKSAPGKRVLVVGESVKLSPETFSELYDPAAGITELVIEAREVAVYGAVRVPGGEVSIGAETLLFADALASLSVVPVPPATPPAAAPAPGAAAAPAPLVGRITLQVEDIRERVRTPEKTPRILIQGDVRGRLFFSQRAWRQREAPFGKVEGNTTVLEDPVPHPEAVPAMVAYLSELRLSDPKGTTDLARFWFERTRGWLKVGEGDRARPLGRTQRDARDAFFRQIQ